MILREFGKTGLMVNEIGFGGEWLERHPEKESIEMMNMLLPKELILLAVRCLTQNLGVLLEKQTKEIEVIGMLLVAHIKMDNIIALRYEIYCSRF